MSALTNPDEHAAVQQAILQSALFQSESERVYAVALATTVYLAVPYPSLPNPASYGLRDPATIERAETAMHEIIAVERQVTAAKTTGSLCGQCGATARWLLELGGSPDDRVYACPTHLGPMCNTDAATIVCPLT